MIKWAGPHLGVRPPCIGLCFSTVTRYLGKAKESIFKIDSGIVRVKGASTSSHRNFSEFLVIELKHNNS